MKRIVFVLLFALIATHSFAEEHRYTVVSPDGNLVSNIVCSEKVGITYDVVYNGTALMLPSNIGLTLKVDENLVYEWYAKNVVRRTVDEVVASPFTRQSSMRNHCNELAIEFRNGLELIFRLYNEGVAYRFRWLGDTAYVCSEEITYRFADDCDATVPYVIHYDTTDISTQFCSSFENTYTTLPLSQLDTRRLCFLPLLVHAPGGVKLCITESALLDYPGLYLKGVGEKGLLSGCHAPVPKRVEQGGHNQLQLIVRERENYLAKIDKMSVMPWRIIMVAPNSAKLAENNLSYLLGEPCQLDDLSWIKPGKVAWDWWNCWNISGVDFEAGVNNDTYKVYIDFASKYGIEYVILDEGWAVNLKADLFEIVPEIDLPMLVKYAEERGVGIILWAGYYAFDREMERVCRHYSKMGVKGFKIDFMDRDDQFVTDFYRRAARMCAKYHLVVDFHGAFKPAGLNRTFPNVLNFEGVSGLEQLKWSPADRDQVQYDVEIPYIRQAAGPMDYTQGAMLNAAKGCYNPCWSEPMSQGTRCHQLALYVVLESPLNMMCDSPTNYEREPDYTRFVASLPTVWDETRVLMGEVGEYIVTARRKGDTWYIGGITNWTPRDLDVDLSTLADSQGNKINTSSLTVYCDGANAHRKGSDYKVLQCGTDAGHLRVHLAPGGGFLAKTR